MAGRIESEELSENAEINITPFIDVMLVLLIIFMVAAPLSTVDVPIELPYSNAEAQPRNDAPVIVTLKKDLSILVQDEAPNDAGFISSVDVATGLNRETRIYLQADQDVPYVELMSIMNKLRAGGYVKVGLVGLADETDPSASADQVLSQDINE